MIGVRTRRPTLDDVPAILAVVHAADIAATGAPDFSADDVVEVLTAPNMDPAVDSWLAVDEAGDVLAWAYLENPTAGPRDFVEVYAHPERGLAAQRPLLDLLLGRVAQRAAAFGRTALTARAGAVTGQDAWRAALTDAGFTFVKRYARMRGPLSGAGCPPPPDEVVVRPVRAGDEADLRLLHAIIEEAFADSDDHPPTGYPQWRAQLATLPSIAWDEWFVAEVHGVPAGALQSSDQALDQNEGWVKMLAVRRAYRRRGVGGALLRRAFATYAAKGRTSVGLGVDLTNPTEPQRLYRSVGLTPAYQADMFERTVDRAAPN